MKTKTCGECCGFSESENRCLLLGGRGKAYADNEACRRFSEKKPIPPITNGDVIRQMSNEELAKHWKQLLCYCCIHGKRVDSGDGAWCNAPPGTDCSNGFLAWLNAPAAVILTALPPIFSSEKFTKEPWEISDMSGVDAMDNFTVCFHIGVSSTGEMIAELQSDDKKDYEHVKANARLIKAAPIMYDMLNSLLNSDVYHLDELTRDNIRYELRKIKCE